ncbi:MAG: 4-hydroxythreonine-4-phosphate dehydrogenase PdxA [Moraxellaceae bacterium]|nr:4-hydroxythreonine-4-phosphate dehydrogenase PdxA [Moraxellaceae bacterium]
MGYQTILKNLPPQNLPPQSKNNLPILITTGEPAGIGMDIVLDLAEKNYFQSLNQPIVVTGCEKSLKERLALLSPPPFEGGVRGGLLTWKTINHIEEIDQKKTGNFDFYLLNIPTSEKVIHGKINTANASMVLQQLAIAHELAINKKISGIVTAPLQKSALIDANLTLPDGSLFSGHTEYFMQMSDCQKVVMMLANDKLKVTLVTTHLPLSQVAQAITPQAVRQTVQIVLDSMQQQFGIKQPKVLVCGLNPHAGEGGHLGMEEIEIINPILQEFIDKGHDVSLAMPADTLFTPRYLADCDVTIAMYHDQGLPVLKSHGFGNSVNVTLGLPYVRTSVDHGTALDLAGSGRADSSSLKQAVEMLRQMSL